MSNKQSSIEWLEKEINRRGPKEDNPPQWLQELYEQAKEMERELIKESCIMAIMQWNEWDKTNYLDLYDHKVEGAEIWAEDYCKELYEEIEVPNPKQETHICKYCNAETWQSDDECYANPKITNNHIVDANKKVSSIEWLSNQTYELFEQYSEGKFDRVQLNKLMVDATNKAKEMEKHQIIDAHLDGQSLVNCKDKYAEQYYNQTFKSE